MIHPNADFSRAILGKISNSFTNPGTYAQILPANPNRIALIACLPLDGRLSTSSKDADAFFVIIDDSAVLLGSKTYGIPITIRRADIGDVITKEIYFAAAGRNTDFCVTEITDTGGHYQELNLGHG